MSIDIGGITNTRYPQTGEPNPIVRVGVVRPPAVRPNGSTPAPTPDVYLPRVELAPDSRSTLHRASRPLAETLDLLLVRRRHRQIASPSSPKQDRYWINVSDRSTFSPTANASSGPASARISVTSISTTQRQTARNSSPAEIGSNQQRRLRPAGANGLIADEAPAKFISFRTKKIQSKRNSIASRSPKNGVSANHHGRRHARRFLSPDASAFVEVFPTP